MWTAPELYEKGIVDLVAETATGAQAVVDYLHRQERVGIGTFGLIRARHRVQPVSYQELFDVAMIWADSALHLGERDLRVMERLLRAQNRAYGLAPSPSDAAKVVPLIS
jgi:DSF synthase